MDFTGKTAFITGSASGLGKGFAEKLLQGGANVYISDVNQEMGSKTLREFQEKFGFDRCAFSVLDVANEKQFNEVFQEAIKVFGDIDIMINNAGIVNEVKWLDTIHINLIGTVTGTFIAFEHMRKDKNGRGGRIINVSSRAGLEDAFPLPVYAGTKHAVRAFTTSIAKQPDLPSQGIECAVLCPDSARTGIRKDFSSKVNSYHDRIQGLLKGKSMTVEDVAKAVIHLLEQENMNGAILYVNTEGMSFQKVESVNLGPTWDPPAAPQSQ